MFLVKQANLDCKAYAKLGDALKIMEESYDPSTNHPVVLKFGLNEVAPPTIYKIVEFGGFRFTLEDGEIIRCSKKHIAGEHCTALDYMRAQRDLIKAGSVKLSVNNHKFVDEIVKAGHVHDSAVTMEALGRCPDKDYGKPIPVQYESCWCTVTDSKGVVWSEAFIVQGQAYVLTNNLHEMLELQFNGEKLFLDYRGEKWEIEKFLANRKLAQLKTKAALETGYPQPATQVERCFDHYEFRSVVYRLNSEDRSSHVVLADNLFLKGARCLFRDSKFHEIDPKPIKGQWLLVSGQKIHGYFTNWLALCRCRSHQEVKPLVAAKNPADPFGASDASAAIRNWLKSGIDKTAAH